MSPDIIGVAAATAVGFLVASANYFLSKKVLLRMPEKFSLVTVARQVLQIGFLVIVYFIGDNIEAVNTVALLVGAVFGMTLPMIYFTKKLLSINQTAAKKDSGKEEDVNG